MTTTIISNEKDRIIIKKKPEVWEIKSDKHLLKFWEWVQKKHLIPGDIVPKRRFKKYYRKKEEKG